jgi:hypothetical protein
MGGPSWPGLRMDRGLAKTMRAAREWRQAQCQPMEHNCGARLIGDRTVTLP